MMLCLGNQAVKVLRTQKQIQTGRHGHHHCCPACARHKGIEQLAGELPMSLDVTACKQT